MVLESSGGWHRYIVHQVFFSSAGQGPFDEIKIIFQAVQLFPTLSSFSVGEGSKRRPVVCFKAKLPKSLRHNTPGKTIVLSARPDGRRRTVKFYF